MGSSRRLRLGIMWGNGEFTARSRHRSVGIRQPRHRLARRTGSRSCRRSSRVIIALLVAIARR